MSSVLSEYPETLPAPMVGVVTPTERRKVGSIAGVQSFRTVQRDRHGTRTYAFTFTKEQAAIFREWWVEWEQRGGGWFAANWPLPWSRGPNVFRFKNPPEWALIGGGIDGQGYWHVSGLLEIRGRGMLPTVEVIYLTSTPYPVIFSDQLDIGPVYGISIDIREPPTANFGIDNLNLGNANVSRIFTGGPVRITHNIDVGKISVSRIFTGAPVRVAHNMDISKIGVSRVKTFRDIKYVNWLPEQINIGNVTVKRINLS